MTIEIHIEELVLRGVAPADIDTVTSALRDRLEQLALDATAPAGPLDGAALVHRARPVPAHDATALGRQAAAAVWSAAGGGPS